MGRLKELMGLTDDAATALSKAKVLVPSGSTLQDVAKVTFK